MTRLQLREQIELLDKLKTNLHDAAWESQWQRMLTFSDSIALAVPVKTDDPEIELGSTISSIAYYQYELVCTGRFLRGGTAVGDAYADYANTTGPALVDAAHLEASVAVAPRVLLHESALEEVLRQVAAGFGEKPSYSTFNTTLTVDADSRAFVNYLFVTLEAEENEVEEAEILLERHKHAVIDALTKHSKASQVRQKTYGSPTITTLFAISIGWTSPCRSKSPCVRLSISTPGGSDS